MAEDDLAQKSLREQGCLQNLWGVTLQDRRVSQFTIS